MQPTEPQETKELKQVEDKELEEAFDPSVEVREMNVLEKLDPKTIHAKEKKEMYELWLSIPAMLRLLPDKDLKTMGYDIENPLFMRVLRISTVREFCREFGASTASPTRWQKQDPEIITRAMERSRQDHVLKFGKDVDFSFTQKVIKHGNSDRVKLWNQLNRGWSEKIEHRNTNLNFDVNKFTDDIEKRNAEIRAKADSEANIEPV